MVDYVHAESGPSCVNVQGIREAETAASTVVGSVKQLAYGKEVIYARITTAAISEDVTVGMVLYPEVLVANHGRQAVAVTASIGAKELILSIGGTAAAENLYQNGTLLVECGTGTGYSYMIEGHPAWTATSSAALVVLKDGLEVAANTATLVTLYKNKAMGVTVNNSAAYTGPPIGVTLISAAEGNYVYLGKKGEWPAVIEGTIVTGRPVTSGSAMGTVSPFTAGGTHLGHARSTGSTTGFCIIDFNL